MDKNQILEIISSMKSIVGILSTSQPVKFGKTNLGKPIYLIKPIKSILPPFWITYGGKLKGQIIIHFKFKEWNDTSLPFGETINVIGNVEEANLINTLIYHYNIERKEFKSLANKNPLEDLILRKDLTHLNIFSIDPLGCVDIDDALSIEDNKIGVHIAQPICFLTKDEIIERSKTAFSTLYCNSLNKNLWSNEITEKASLFVNQIKPAYSIIFTIENNKIVSIEHNASLIKNKLNTDYDNINYKNILDCKKMTEDLIGKEIDSHELVSYWMIKANEFIGNNFNNIPFRSQLNNNVSNLPSNLPKNISTIFSNFQKEGACYSYENDYHHSLDLTKYTHFTSPIRRMIDTIIHWNVTYKDFPEEKIIIDLDRINTLDKKTKKFHNQMNINTIIEKLPDEKETIGWIFSKLENKWMVYFEELGLVKVKVWDKKLDYLIDKKEYDKYIIGNSYEFKLFKKIGFLPSQKMLINLKNK